MNIVLGKENVATLTDKYTVLELDTLRINNLAEPVTAYCLVEIEKIPLVDLSQAENFKNLHNNMMRNYRLKNWQYCESALEHLFGKWQGELDSFYQELLLRITSLKQQDLPEDWDGTVAKN